MSIVRSIQAAIAAAAALIWLAAPLPAQDWPTRSVRIVSPFAAGGSSDTLGRVIGEALSEKFGQQFILENRGGAGGLIGSALVASAAPDGTTFLLSSIGTHVTAPATSENPPYDPIASFTQVAYLGGPPIVIVAYPSLGARSFADLIALLKGGREIAYMSPGPGTVGHLIGEYLAERERVKLTHVAYKGSGQAMSDLIAGHVPLGSVTWAAALAQMRAGTVVPLAVSSARQMPGFADVPTLDELGYSDLVVTTWFGIAAPAGLPDAITQRMNTEVGHALDATTVRERLSAEGVEYAAMTPAALTAFIRRDIARWAPLAKRLMQAGGAR